MAPLPQTQAQAQAHSIARAMATSTYRAIDARLRGFNPPICIANHIDGKLIAHDSTLDGINFLAKDAEALKTALRNARDSSGDKAFEEGGIGERSHWALKLSFGATEGTGFRESWHMQLSDRPLSVADARDRFAPSWSDRLSGRFANSPVSRSSLHCGISKGLCNIHIDETGFVATLPNGEVIVDLDALQHIANELLLKTYLKQWVGRAPWLFDHLSILLPTSANGYSGLAERAPGMRGLRDLKKLDVGLSLDIPIRKDVRVTLKAQCSLPNCRHEWSGTVTLDGRFGGKRW